MADTAFCRRLALLVTREDEPLADPRLADERYLDPVVGRRAVGSVPEIVYRDTMSQYHKNVS